MIADESQEIGFEAFNEQIKPFGTRTGGILFAIGTTLSNPDNVLFDMYSDKDITPDRKLMYTWEDVYRYKMMVSNDLAEKYERRVQKEIKKYGLNSDYVQSQYYVSFDIVGSKFMTIEKLRSNNIMRGTYGTDDLVNKPYNFVVAGFDPAVVNDYAALTIGESTLIIDENDADATRIQNKLKSVSILNRDKHRVSIDYLLEYLCENCEKHKIDMLMFDSTAGQEHAVFYLVEKLRERNINTMVIPYSFSGSNKVAMMQYFEDSLFNQTLILPSEDYRNVIEDYDELLEELCYLQREMSPSGKPTYKAPEGTSFFDDCVMSLALMNYCAYYSIMFAYKKVIDLGGGVVYPIKPHKYISVEKKKRKRVGYY